MDNTMPTQSAQQKRRSGGRPRLLPEERKSIQIKVGFTPAQAEQLSERADRAGIKDIELIRRLSLNQQINTIPSANREALIELNRIGNNLNQIAKGINAGAIKLERDQARAWFEKFHAILQSVGVRLTHGD